MDNVNNQSSNPGTSNPTQKAHVADAASELLNESKKYAHELYEEGMHKVHDVQKHAREYSDELIEKVRKNPMASILVAAGVGFILSAMLRK